MIKASDVQRLVSNAIERAVKRLERRIAGIVAVAVIEQINAGTKFQTLKGTAYEGDTDDAIQLFEQGGIWHVALPGAEGLTFAIAGRGANRAAIGVSNRSARPTGGAAGETGLWSAGENAGTKVLLRSDGEVIVTPQSKLRVVGDLHVTGEVVAMCDSTAVFLSQHLHPTAVGPTSPPTPMPPVPPDLAIP